MTSERTVREWKTAEWTPPEGGSFKYAILCLLGGIKILKPSEIEPGDWEEFIEAWLFDENSELHLYREDDRVYAVSVSDAGNEKIDEESCLVCYKMRGGKKLLVREYFEMDQDGQAVIVHRRPAGIE